MDSYDEVHDVKNGRDISTPDLDVSSAIRFVNSEQDDDEDEDDDDEKVELEGNTPNASEEVKLTSHADSCEN